MAQAWNRWTDGRSVMHKRSLKGGSLTIICWYCYGSVLCFRLLMRWSAAGLDHPRWWIYFTRCLVHTRAQQSFGKTISPTFSITSFKRSVICCDGLLVVCHLVCIRLYLFFLLTDLVCLCYGFLCFYVSVFFEYFLLVVITTSVDCLERVISRMTNCMLSRTLNHPYLLTLIVYHAYSPHTHCIPCPVGVKAGRSPLSGGR